MPRIWLSTMMLLISIAPAAAEVATVGHRYEPSAVSLEAEG